MRPDPSLAWRRLAMRRGRAALNGSLTIIVLTPLTTFSAARFGARRSSIWICWSISYRDGGASKGPEQARAPLSRCLAMPCADRPDRNRSPGPDRHAGPVQPDARQPGDVSRIRRCAGPAAEASDPPTIRGCDDRTSPRRRGSARSRHTACPPRAAPPSPVTTRSTASARSRNSIRARPSRKPPPGPGSRAAAGRRRHDGRVRLSVPPSRIRQQDADPAGDGRHGGRPAAAQAAQDR